MLYTGYQAFSDMMAPARSAAEAAVWLGNRAPAKVAENPLVKRYLAFCEVFAGAKMTHGRPGFGIEEVECGNRMVDVVEEVVESLPFGDLLHFSKPDVVAAQPKVLVAAPLSGHFATLLRDTVETLLPDHDVYITDWRNAREVPLREGPFGFDDYIDYLMKFMRVLGPGSSLLAVCQPCVQALAATALMAEDRDPCQPRALVLMGGPIDTRVAPTVVNELATNNSYSWFENNVIYTVPWRHRGAGRKVYPGFLQLTAFVSMNPIRHLSQHRNLYKALVAGKEAEADKIQNFYEEYFAVLDMAAEFYLETIDKVFQRMLLAKGELVYRDERTVDCSHIRHTALLTVEGERDDICSVGQTAAAHTLCSSLRPHLKRHYLQAGAGHYGIFSGSKWEKQVYPQVRNTILAVS